MKPSFLSKIIAGILKLTKFNKTVEKQSTQKQIKRSTKDFTPKNLTKKYTVTTQKVNTKTIATFENKQGATSTHLVFLHGGAYIFEIGSIHWSFAQKIMDKINCKTTMIDYPLAPEHDYKTTFEMVNNSYNLLVEQYPKDDFVFIGDSAGAGLAMGFFQKLIQEKHPKLPTKVILLSPWLDLTMSNPEAKKFESTDYLLTVKMLQNAANSYANGDDQNQYLLSPINGELNTFPPTIVFYSNTELFYPDCLKLKEIVRNNHNFVFKEYEKMLHDWPMFPIPESDMVVNDICAFLGR